LTQVCRSLIYYLALAFIKAFVRADFRHCINFCWRIHSALFGLDEITLADVL
jgi:hypothetical protein